MAADSVVLWTPTAERVAACQLTAFRTAVAERHGLDLPDYAALHAWSVAEREDFWREVWALGDVVGDGSLDRALLNDVMPGAKWFPDASLNYAENCLRRRDDAAPAIISSVEGTNRREITWGQLYSQVAQLSAWLRDHGVGPGVRLRSLVVCVCRDEAGADEASGAGEAAHGFEAALRGAAVPHPAGGAA